MNTGILVISATLRVSISGYPQGLRKRTPLGFYPLTCCVPPSNPALKYLAHSRPQGVVILIHELITSPMKRIPTISVILFVIKLLSGLSSPDTANNFSCQKTSIQVEHDSIQGRNQNPKKWHDPGSNYIFMTSTISQNASIELL